MLRHGLVAAVVVLLLSQTQKAVAQTPHLEMDMSGQEYSQILSQIAVTEDFNTAHDNGLKMVLKMGKRNLEWLKFINDNRDEKHRISLTSAATQMGNPIESPRLYNPSLILKKYQDLIGQIPDSIKTVVLGSGSYPTNPPVSDEEFCNWGRKLDSQYQMAARWTLMEGYLAQMAQKKTEDVRGFYFLSKDSEIEKKLRNWKDLDQQTKVTFEEYLVEMCYNNELPDGCFDNVEKAINRNIVFELYQRYFPKSKNLWDSFFSIQQNRRDVQWKHNPEELHVPFRDPNNAKVKSYLSDNIQDEWKWNDWHLLLDFRTDSQDMPEVQFEAGSTPHVNAIAGNIITMDDNAPLTEYDVQWTIRHEFGHVLGFPDCYVEFYDEPNAVMISYQLDITNLMCSRKGHLKEIHFNELKRAYGSLSVNERL
jgi:hypothetical protein